MHIYYSSALFDRSILIGRRDLECRSHSRIGIYMGNTLFLNPYFEQTEDSKEVAYLAWQYMYDDRSWALLCPLIGHPFVVDYNRMISDLLENNAQVLRKEYPSLRFVDEDPEVG